MGESAWFQCTACKSPPPLYITLHVYTGDHQIMHRTLARLYSLDLHRLYSGYWHLSKHDTSPCTMHHLPRPKDQGGLPWIPKCNVQSPTTYIQLQIYMTDHQSLHHVCSSRAYLRLHSWFPRWLTNWVSTWCWQLISANVHSCIKISCCWAEVGNTTWDYTFWWPGSSLHWDCSGRSQLHVLQTWLL